jgi:predicted enzyme related to lactoylglutathione lyase
MAVPQMGYLVNCIDTEGNPFGLWEENPKAQ